MGREARLRFQQLSRRVQQRVYLYPGAEPDRRSQNVFRKDGPDHRKSIKRSRQSLGPGAGTSVPVISTSPLLLNSALLLMTITVNGDSRELPQGETVRALIARYQLDANKVAVELNRRLLKSEKYDQALKDGDEVELVTFVGGG